jgi:nucleotidyltransferase/DNA polymerase involved in DNA repair
MKPENMELIQPCLRHGQNAIPARNIHTGGIRTNTDEYSKASNEITDILRERVPVIEKASIDRHYIDMTGINRFHSTEKYAHELKELPVLL